MSFLGRKAQEAKTFAALKAIDAAMVAARVVSPERLRALLISALTILRIYIGKPEDLTGLGEAMADEVDKLGGLVRKAVQQASQLPDIISSPEIRHGLKRLQGAVKARSKEQLQKQLTEAFPDKEILLDNLCGAGCMGEVSLVKVRPSGCGSDMVTMCAKTANMEQKAIFETDFELFKKLSDHMAPAVRCLRLFDRQTADEVEAVVGKITDMGRNDDVVRSIRNGFDMRVEAEHSRRGAETVKQIKGSDAIFSVPEMHGVSADGGALLMELVNGTILEKKSSGDLPSHFVKDFVGVYVGMVGKGFLHQDLHPANIFVLESGKYALIDWGEIVEVPQEHQADAQILLRTVAAGCWMGAEGDSLGKLFQRLQVTVKPDRSADEKAYQALASMLDVVLALRGDTQVNNANLVAAAVFQSPGWFESWQKAANAFAISMQAAGCTPETLSNTLRVALELPVGAAASGGA